MNGNDPFLSSLYTNLQGNTIQPNQLPNHYQLAEGTNGGRGYISPDGTVTFHDTVNGKMTVDKQHDRIKRGS